MLRPGTLTSVSVVMACMVTAGRADAAEATASVRIHAQMSSRTALQISTQSLHFEVVNPAEAATAHVDFSAAARTEAGADVVLMVEGLQAPGDSTAGPNGRPSLSFAGQGAGTRAGEIRANAPAVAAKWVGSGRRSGRLVFMLRARAAGVYSTAVRFVLAAP